MIFFSYTDFCDYQITIIRMKKQRTGRGGIPFVCPQTKFELKQKAEEVHGIDRYDYPELNDTSAIKNSYSRIKILCLIHNTTFTQTIYDHIRRKYGCRTCGHTTCDNKRKLRPEIVLAQFFVIHGFKYDYSKFIYVNDSTKGIVICQLHGEFSVSPNRHKSGDGCRDCGYILVSQKLSDTTETFIEKSFKIHGDRYDYSKVEYKGTLIHVCIICKIHGDFWQKPNSHLQNRGCRKCGFEANKYTKEEIIERSNKKYGIDKFDFSLFEYDGIQKKSTLRCVKHNHMFITDAFSHLASTYGGCVWCHKCGYSVKQIKWLNHIMDTEDIFIKHALNGGEHVLPKNIKVDGYCEETNTVYEYHGCFYHSCLSCNSKNNPDYADEISQLSSKNKHLLNKDVYLKTLKKDDKIQSLGYSLIVRWEHEGSKDTF